MCVAPPARWHVHGAACLHRKGFFAHRNLTRPFQYVKDRWSFRVRRDGPPGRQADDYGWYCSVSTRMCGRAPAAASCSSLEDEFLIGRRHKTKWKFTPCYV